MKTIIRFIIATIVLLWATVAVVTVSAQDYSIELGRYLNGQFISRAEMPTFEATNDFGRGLEKTIQQAWVDLEYSKYNLQYSNVYVNNQGYACTYYSGKPYVVGKATAISSVGTTVVPTAFKVQIDTLRSPTTYNQMANAYADSLYAKHLADSIATATIDSLSFVSVVQPTTIKATPIRPYTIVVPCGMDKDTYLKSSKGNPTFDNLPVNIIVEPSAKFVDAQTQLELQYYSRIDSTNSNTYLDSLDFLLNIQANDSVITPDQGSNVIVVKNVSKKLTKKAMRQLRKEQTLRNVFTFFDRNAEETFVVKLTNSVVFGDGFLSPNGNENCGGDMTVKRQIINQTALGVLSAGVLPALHWGQKLVFKGIAKGIALVNKSVRNNRLKNRELVAQK